MKQEQLLLYISRKFISTVRSLGNVVASPVNRRIIACLLRVDLTRKNSVAHDCHSEFVGFFDIVLDSQRTLIQGLQVSKIALIEKFRESSSLLAIKHQNCFHDWLCAYPTARLHDLIYLLTSKRWICTRIGLWCAEPDFISHEKLRCF